MYSILILDVSGSMSSYYNSLIKMANEIITKQMENNENEGVVILFGTYAKAIINGKYRLLDLSDIGKANVNAGTNFYNAFIEAEKYIYNKENFMNKRILFLTDGEASSSQLRPICNKMIQQKFQINIVGFGESSWFEDLKQFASPPKCFYTSQNFEEVATICKKISAAEY